MCNKCVKCSPRPSRDAILCEATAKGLHNKFKVKAPQRHVLEYTIDRRLQTRKTFVSFRQNGEKLCGNRTRWTVICCQPNNTHANFGICVVLAKETHYLAFFAYISQTFYRRLQMPSENHQQDAHNGNITNCPAGSPCFD